MKIAGLPGKINRFIFEKNLGGWLYALLLAGVAGMRLLVAASQRVYLLPEGSGIDDMLMIRAAESIAAGNWLGAYGGVAIAKNMGFALWLALLHMLRVPFLLGNAALWLAACGFAVWALRPLFKGNIGRLLLFAFLVFQPFSYAFFTQRVYRDSVFPAFCLLFFAGFLGLCLRLAQPVARGSAAAALGAGLGFTAAWLTREDGPVLLAFAVCAALVLAAFVLFNKQVQKKAAKLLCVFLPFIMLGAGVLGFSAANQKHYGVFMVSDLTQGEFPLAYGAVAAVSAAESGFVPFVPVTQYTLEKLYEEVPTMAQLRPQLESGKVKNGFADRETGEYAGSFYFALRFAADYGGLTPDGASAQAFWKQLWLEVEQAVAEGRLQSEKPTGGTVPRWNGTLLMPTARETGRNLLAMLTITDTFGPADIRPMESVGPAEKIERVARFLHSPVQQGYVEGTDQPYYNPLQKICFALCGGITWVYRILLWPLLALALFALVRGLGKGLAALFKKRVFGQRAAVAVLALGLLLSVLLRAGVTAYMEVAAFNIGTYLMYLSGAVPALLLFFAVSLGLSRLPDD